MNSVLFLIIFPLAVAGVYVAIRAEAWRNMCAKITAGALAVAAGLVMFRNFGQQAQYFLIEKPFIEPLITVCEIAIALYVVREGFRHKRFLAPALVALQVGVMVFFVHHAGPFHDIANICVDKLAIIMALIIAIAGGLIAIYAPDYMKEFTRHHKDVADRRPFFFFTIFIFLSAMFGIVFSNDLLWLNFFWEVTTFCSFVMIGYKQDAASVDNAFRALLYNVFGGIAFSAAIIYLYHIYGTIELNRMVALGKVGILAPVVLLCFAAFTKAAQMPFSSWLLGAMAAPTPVSALLHSSTMVKAGVYILVRMAPALQNTAAGFLCALIGAFTFLIASCMAVTVSDAKRVLAYSTIANLGLITLCAGIGTYESVWAAILLIIFHAVAKGLLFLCVGTIEHRIGSRDIEDMGGLIISMPKVSIMMQIGMAGMFLAPFGMLISKWAVLKALVDTSPILAMFVIFGGAVTLMYWVKWMGQLLIVTHPEPGLEKMTSKNEFLVLGIFSSLTLLVCALFPVISSLLIEPYIRDTFGKVAVMGQGNILIMLIMLGLVMLFPLTFFSYGKRVKFVDPYLGGANAASTTAFNAAMGKRVYFTMGNYYLKQYFGEQRLFKVGVVVTGICLAILMGFVLIWRY